MTHLAFALMSIAITIVGYTIYIREVLRGNTKPHLFTWLIWATITAIAFVGQVASGAGVGAYAIGTAGLGCFVIVALAIRRGTTEATRGDWASLVAAFMAIGLYVVTKNALLAVLLATAIDILGFIPTVAKSVRRPLEEPVVPWVLGIFQFGAATLAVETLSFTALFYPVALTAMNMLHAAVLIHGRLTPPPTTTPPATSTAAELVRA